MDNGNDILPTTMEAIVGLHRNFCYGHQSRKRKFCSHVDYWGSIKNNEYFSSEGLVDLVKQLRIYKTPNLETPKYQILKRTATYEVRKYSPFIIDETQSDKVAGSTGFNDVGIYLGRTQKRKRQP
ncbi:hypothetical protein L1887_10803 [Cichorium endivia]|nr:hypothetical protein L1887_10803 [Cichorium endivia]